MMNLLPLIGGPAGLLFIILSLVAAIAIGTYNKLVGLRQEYRSAFSDIDVQLKQRHDIVSNLVQTVKGYATHESDILQKVTELRNSATQAKSLSSKNATEGALSSALPGIFALAENYPQLKADENFRQLQTELSDLENKIAEVRHVFNGTVAVYNTALTQFPAVLFAGMLGFLPAHMFELGAGEKDEADKAPQISFD